MIHICLVTLNKYIKMPLLKAWSSGFFFGGGGIFDRKYFVPEMHFVRRLCFVYPSFGDLKVKNPPTRREYIIPCIS